MDKYIKYFINAFFYSTNYGVIFGIISCCLFTTAQIINKGCTNITPISYVILCLGLGFVIFILKYYGSPNHREKNNG